ncbi:ABC transporter substrate-binding protein [Actinobacteria bacterium YIM 96077]|uniref:ABC transporter substrate-binding protein n=1 Tax=Phytoactinopolyspora halophila TaxID=1981511 RepID=A0A329QR88_9ACTN|nr:ABC transporter substrate-binding protein [Phytoactinopolyspora halophila]AYY14322.1 ABC transporter substrate-binding protein [Actinobacteria bacterium YIM 96077]RAW14865.1 ABC transporter substrate-binding protein [Phytoactinopolyspora halophila]
MGSSARCAVMVLVAGAVFALSACGVDDEGESGQARQEIAVRGCSPENPLIPGMTMESCGGQIVNQLFSMLIRYEPDTGEPVNEIAESIESDDNRTWTITLEDGWTFHNGEPITAHNFVNAWNWNAYAPNGTLNSYYFRAIEGYADLQPSDEVDSDEEITPDMVESDEMSGLQIIDDMTFKVTLSRPESSFPLRLGYVAFAPLPEHFFDNPEEFGENPVGSGPFQLVDWNRNVDIRLRAFPGYRGEVQPQVDEVNFRIYRDDTAAYNDLQADNLDIMPYLPSAALADSTYKGDLGDRYVREEALAVSTIMFPPESVDPSLSDPRLRRAISMAIDRESIIDAIFHGSRDPATGWVPPGVEGYRPDVCGEYCEYDPDAARDLFDEAGGYDGALTISYNADGDNRAWVEATCHSISDALDVECVGKPVPDFKTFRSQINADEMTGMFRNSWNADYPSIESFLAPVYATDAAGNDAGHHNPEFDELVAEAATLSGEDALEKYKAAEELLVEKMPSIPLWYSTIVAGYSTRVENVKITPFQTVDLLSVRLDDD